MKRKIVLSLLALFIFSATGAITATLYIRNTTSTLGRLVQLHQIADLRQHLITSIQTVQSELYTVGTVLGHDVDFIADHVGRLEETADKCTSCHEHHSADVITGIGLIQTDIRQYENALSTYIVASANKERITKLKLEAAEIGNRLLARTEKMSTEAADKLKATTGAALNKIDRAQMVLYLTMLVTFVLGAAIAVNLTASITRPIGVLVSAAREIAAGDLGHTIAYRDRTEFGELAANFNAMSVALRDGYAKLHQEIAERRATETALVKSEAFLATIFDSIRDPFCIFDRDFAVVRANEAYAQMKQKGLGDLIGKTCHRVLENRDAVCDGCIVRKSFLSGDSCAKEKMAFTPEGMRIWLAVYTYPIVDSRGHITHIIEYTRDVTQRKMAEEALRESEERYALAAQGANDGLWDWDLKGNKVYYSHRWKTMLGHEEKEIGDGPEEWLGRIHRDDREQVEAKLAAHLHGQLQNFESEHRILHKDGSLRWVLSRGTAVRDAGKAYRMAGSLTDITARKTAEEQLLHDAFHDALTGLPNRALFLDRLQHVIESAQRHPDYIYAVLFLDIDRFKVINDSLGHGVGDLLLVEAGTRLHACLRPGDTVARLGGDEFAVLLENIRDATDAADVAERIQKAMAPSFFIQGHEAFVTQSIGIALKSDRYTGSEQILRDSDIAMYQAKAKGKARYEFFDTTMHASILDRLQLEADLRLAVEHREGFVLHYQPIMDLKDHRLIGFEALIRWRHPKRGLIYPMEFIPLAEETGMIFPISEWVVRESSEQIRAWQKLYSSDTPLKMSMNISSRQFLQPRFVEKIAAILEEVGVSAASLALEITEGVIMENSEAAVATMARLKAMGVHIHIDDFGTGYSSLSYLHHFPVNALKIDRSFISKMVTNDENREIVKTIVALAQSLNLDVIAEGVELADQLTAVKDMACRYGQGFLFAKPMTAEAMEDWIRENKSPGS
jgi:diguanylate cyclase (GGDEF)-like protein/PAS domain S-box-containing protein